MALVALLLASDVRVVQYAPRAAVLKGCAECREQPVDDACEVRAGFAIQPIDDYAKDRWPAPGRLKLLRSKAEPDCAVPAKVLLGPRAQVKLLAVRMESAPPAAALLDKLGPGVDGWPQGQASGLRLQASGHLPTPSPPMISRQPDRAALREAVICWPSERGWPQAVARDARPLDASNRCEAWLLSVNPDTGEPDPDGASFRLRQASFAYAAPEPAAPAPPREAPAPAAREPAPKAQAPPHCTDAARAQSATLDRFDQWDRQIRSATRASLDRGAWTLDAAAWAGHCQELEVLHAAIEQQLSCAVALLGRCVPGEAR